MATTRTVCKLIVVKTIPYRGSTRRFSNAYCFKTGTPADDSHWHTLMDNVTTAEKAIFTSGVTIVEALGYGIGSDIPLSSKTYSLAGTGAWTNVPCPGDSAAMLRYSTAARSTKNHPVYLFNYFHGATWSGSGSSDTLAAGQKSAIETYAGLWDTTGFSDGTNTYKRCGPASAAATGHECDPYVRHHDFPT